MAFKIKSQKKVFNQVSGLADAFAEGLTSGKARADSRFPNGRVFIEGNKIYSYGHHFPIAEKTGDKEVLFNTKKVSLTTSKQQSKVRQALSSHGYKIIDKELKGD